MMVFGGGHCRCVVVAVMAWQVVVDRGHGGGGASCQVVVVVVFKLVVLRCHCVSVVVDGGSGG